ncbi:MAG: hypothetical protein OEW30_07555 [Acidimicrobiia bacterium]|nr:hypothetical protein [Acidimicrobiia bacterium]
MFLIRAAVSEFERASTTIGTFDEPDSLVTTGPFARTRNPMYLGMALGLSGVALNVGTVPAWAGPAAFAALANCWYIPHEELALRRAFGCGYDRYRCLVPRWFGPRPPVRESTA